MPTVDATVKGLSANSYINVADADAYFDTRLRSSVWNDATTGDKERALLTAARQLDTLVRWKGTKTTVEQRMQWPRYNVPDHYADEAEAWYLIDQDTIPEFLRQAQCEQAIAMLAEDRTAEQDSKGLRSFSAGELSVTFDKSDPREVLSPTVQGLIESYAAVMSGAKPLTVPVIRV